MEFSHYLAVSLARRVWRDDLADTARKRDRLNNHHDGRDVLFDRRIFVLCGSTVLSFSRFLKNSDTPMTLKIFLSCFPVSLEGDVDELTWGVP